MKGKTKMATKQKAAEAEQEATESKRAEREARNEALSPQIVEMRENGAKWSEIQETLGIAQGRAMLLFLKATTAPKERINGKTDEELAAKIVKARNEDKLSWGQISARSGIGEGRARSLFEQASGESARGNRVGRGGRYPDGDTPPAKETKAKAPAKKAAAKKAAPTNPRFGLSPDELSEAITGKTISFRRNGKSVRAKVAEVTDVTGTGAEAEITLTTEKGAEVTVVNSDISKVV